MTQALSCRDVSVRFGAFSALESVTLDFEQGITTALIGPNGAGKTTLLNTLSGLQKVSDGKILLNGTDITGAPAHARARQGLSRSFQIVTVFPQMTVLENVRFARQRHHMPFAVPWQIIDRYRLLHQEVERTLERFALLDVAHLPAGTLSHGRQRALELAMVLVNEPRVLLLDEPLAGVGHSELDAFTELVREQCRGRTTILVEHNMDVVLSMADIVVVLAAGQVIAQGTPAEIRQDARVQDAYLGG
ncbi:MAG TPA: ABC transporter ATP-binding protein [Rhodospirillaceae bacterium]|nr:ABC transporter ATP-binding protein [Rhodospirillaceae bacterium]MAX62392.1 ABC transporter ATP-binding protein [Rhodospirillaceae bacterium]MBB56219.1 ABC transporter ATP-binding protein [Rhodospirillaceae bacterium]HAJ21605.1 ABC transporter ATP-binding protein [Rhodospirillaceae bacterium]HBM12995.1 ABC transporter ATP-binding protein [Rhodospirillaceae bacterium]|tara:strand:+ start:61778 stop:62518 length:741 start_codon:yes stop_codon:yes gene_type:complete